MREEKNMKRKLLAIATMTAVAGPAGAVSLDIGGSDWQIRWDNTVKFNVMSRVAKQDKDVYTPKAGAAWQLADDADLSVDRSNFGLVSTRLDILTELDAVYKRDFGFRVSAAGWYDPMYKDTDHPSDRINTWASPSVDPGEINDPAKEFHYLGGEILDAFVFANFSVGDIYANLRLGRHTIYWGGSLLGTGATHGIAGSMTTIDFNKALSVPGSEAKELFLPSNKLSTSVQLTYNLSVNAFYSFEHREYRLPWTGTYFSIAEGLNEDTEFVTLAPFPGAATGIPGLENVNRIGYDMDANEDKDGDWGINFQYFVEPWLLETSWVYMNYVGKTPEGLVGTAITRGLTNTAPGDFYDDGALAVGNLKWLYKDDIELWGVSFAKEIAGISFGLDILTRRDAPLPPELGRVLFRYADPEAGAIPGLGLPIGDAEAYAAADTGSNYGGPVGDTWHLVLNGLGLLNDNGIWQGGSWLAELTLSALDDCTENCFFLSQPVQEGRINSHIGLVFRPTWFQVFPGVDVSAPVAVGYGIDGDQAPIAFGGNEESGSASIGVDFDIQQKYSFVARYNTFFGPVNNGLGGLLKDRDNVSFTFKTTF
jgi:hypothetical protein